MIERLSRSDAEILEDAHSSNGVKQSSAPRRSNNRDFLEQQIDYKPSPEFDDLNGRQEIIQTLPVEEEFLQWKPATYQYDYFPSLGAMPRLSQQDEHHLFRKMHFFRFEAEHYRHVTAEDISKLSRIQINRRCTLVREKLQKAIEMRNTLVKIYLPYTATVSSRQAGTIFDTDECVSIGAETLMRGVELYDYRRPEEFKAYIRGAIYREIRHAVAREMRRRHRTAALPDSHHQCEGERQSTGQDFIDEKMEDPREAVPLREQSSVDVRRVLRIISQAQRSRVRDVYLRVKSSSYIDVAAQQGLTKQSISKSIMLAFQSIRRAIAEGRITIDSVPDTWKLPEAG